VGEAGSLPELSGACVAAEVQALEGWDVHSTLARRRSLPLERTMQEAQGGGVVAP